MNLRSLREDYVLLASLILLLIITLASPNLIVSYPSFINWETLLTLAALFLITTAIKDSQYLDILASRIIKRTKKERNLALILILLAFILSMVITNDVTLLVLVPLTLSLQKYIARDIKKMIIFEAIAVNAGSALTPIGNPQNLYLWQVWNVGFYEFVYLLLPLALLMLALLLLLAFLSFPAKQMEKVEISESWEEKKVLAVISIVLLLLLIGLMDLHMELYIIPIVFLIYLVLNRRVYLHVDWTLLLIFLLFFLDFNAMAQLPIIKDFLTSQNIHGVSAFAYGAIFSQFMSNVPAAIFLSNFTTDFKALVYGVSVGGNGTIIASLANLIALRMVKDKKLFIEFHKYSLLYFAISFIIVFLLLR